MKKHFAILLLILTFYCGVKAQSGNFHKLVTSLSDLSATSTVLLPNKTHIIVGNISQSVGFFLAMDSMSIVQFFKSYSFNGNTFPDITFSQIITTSDSNFIVCGSIYNPTGNCNDGLIMKLNQSGDTIWSKRIDVSPNSLQINSVCESFDSGFYFSGSLKLSGSGFNTIFAMKSDSTGNSVWSNSYSAGTAENFSKRIYSSPDSACILIGNVSDLPNYNTGAAVFKLHDDGNIDWAKKYSLTGINCSGEDIVILPNSYLFELIANSSTIILQTTLFGNTINDTLITMNSASLFSNFGTRMKLLADSTILLINGDEIFSICVKLDTSFNVIWSDGLAMRTYDFVETPAKELYFIGGGPLIGVGPPTPNGNYLDIELGIVQTDSLGSSGSCIFPVGVGNWPYSLVTDTINSVLTNYGTISSFSPTITPIIGIVTDTCVSFYGSVHEHSAPSPLKIFPNPGTDFFYIENPGYEMCFLRVYNLLQEELFYIESSDQTILLDLKNYADGFYFCKMQLNDGRIFQGKIIKTHQ